MWGHISTLKTWRNPFDSDKPGQSLLLIVMIKMKNLIKESNYKFDNNDVYYGNVLLGSLKETEDGKYKI